MARQLRAFISYSHVDEHALERLTKHLAMLRRDKVISEWFDQKIGAGGDIDATISQRLEQCDLFIALVSVDFLDSHYCYEREMERALELHEKGSLRVVPVIVGPCDWQSSPLGKLKALPKDGKPVSDWTNKDTAWLDVVKQLRNLATDVESGEPVNPKASPAKRTSAKYRAKKDFDDLDRMEFRDNAFAAIRDYFKRASAEINEVEDIKSKFTNMADDAFGCTVVNRARDRAVSHITVYSCGSRLSFGDISFSFQERAPPNTANGWMQIEADDYNLHLKYNDMFRSDDNQKLSPHQAAEILWRYFVERAEISYG